MTESAVADLSAFIPQDVATLKVVVPGTNRPTGWEVTFAGPGHAKTITQTNDLSRRRLRRDAQIEQSQINGRKWKAEDKDPADVAQENVAWVVGRIVDWTPVKIPLFSPEPVEFSEAAAVKLLSQPYMGGYFTQFVEFLANETSFIERSATN